MSQSSFSSKTIQVNFTLAANGPAFGQTQVLSPSGKPIPGVYEGEALGNVKIVSDKLRIACTIKKAGDPAKNECKLLIFGMLPADMNLLSSLGYTSLGVRKNFVQVSVGDSDGLASAYQGEISGAWVNYHKPPDLDFEVHAVEGYYPSLTPARPMSMKGGVPAATLFQSYAQQMSVGFENNGVSSLVYDPYLAGSAFDQAQQLARTVNCEFGVDDGILFIAPRGKLRKGWVASTSPTTGMKEYPIFNKKGIQVEMLYNPFVKLGGLLQISGSRVQQANRAWRIHGFEHTLISHNPHQGHWHTKIHGAPEGSV